MDLFGHIRGNSERRGKRTTSPQHVAVSPRLGGSLAGAVLRLVSPPAGLTRLSPPQAGAALLQRQRPVLPGAEPVLRAAAPVPRVPQRHPPARGRAGLHGPLPARRRVPHVHRGVPRHLQEPAAVPPPKVSGQGRAAPPQQPRPSLRLRRAPEVADPLGRGGVGTEGRCPVAAVQDPVSLSLRASPCHTGQFYGGEAPAPSPPVFPQHGHRSQGRTGQGRWPTRTSGLRRLPAGPSAPGFAAEPASGPPVVSPWPSVPGCPQPRLVFHDLDAFGERGLLSGRMRIRSGLSDGLVREGRGAAVSSQGSTSGARGALLSFDGEADLGRLAGWCPPGSSAVKSLLLPPAERTPCGWDLAAPVPSDGARSPERPPWVS